LQAPPPSPVHRQPVASHWRWPWPTLQKTPSVHAQVKVASSAPSLPVQPAQAL